MIKTNPIHQFVHTLSYGDAISTEVLALRSCFREMGFESEIFALNVHPNYKSTAKTIRHFKEFENQNGALVLHYSLGSPLNEMYSSLGAWRRSIIYHNLTPSHWFEGVNPRICADIEQGLKELPELARVSDLLIADSSYNAGELKELGFDAKVLPLTIDPGRWAEQANPGLTALLKNDPVHHILHVGRMAPNKCVEDIVKTFYFLHYHIDRKTKLWLVGIDTDTEIYSFAVKRLVYELKLSEAVNFVGHLADSELRALYENASAYVCMSEHEGFCLPILEAMHYGLPVLAYASSAVPETLADGGVLVKEKKHPLMAELLYRVCTNSQLRSSLVESGRKRVAELSYANFKNNVVSIFNDFVSGETYAESRSGHKCAGS